MVVAVMAAAQAVVTVAAAMAAAMAAVEVVAEMAAAMAVVEMGVAQAEGRAAAGLEVGWEMVGLAVAAWGATRARVTMAGVMAVAAQGATREVQARWPPQRRDRRR